MWDQNYMLALSRIYGSVYLVSCKNLRPGGLNFYIPVPHVSYSRLGQVRFRTSTRYYGISWLLMDNPY